MVCTLVRLLRGLGVCELMVTIGVVEDIVFWVYSCVWLGVVLLVMSTGGLVRPAILFAWIDFDFWLGCAGR